MKSADENYIKAATAALELGRLLDADDELSKVSEASQHTLAVLKLRADIYEQLEAWEALQPVAQCLTKLDEEDVRWPVLNARAARVLHSIERARDILLEAVTIHVNDPTVQYMLSRYESQLGNIAQANHYLEMAIAVDPRFHLMAANELDLQPVREFKPANDANL